MAAHSRFDNCLVTAAGILLTMSQNFLDIMTAQVWLSLATRNGLGGVGGGVGLSGAVQCALICSESMECRNLLRVAVFPAEAVKPTSASGLFCPWCSSVTSSHSFPLQCVPHLVVQHTSFHWVAPVSPACKIIPGHKSRGGKRCQDDGPKLNV